MWGVAKAGIEPDIMVVGKGITGGMYPIACTVVSEECSRWLKEDGFGHISTGGGAELGCIVALKVLEICGRPEVRSIVHYIADRFRRGLRAIQELYPDWLVGIRQDGVVMGLEFDHPQGAKLVMRHLYEHGVWAIFSTLDPRVLQFKPGHPARPGSRRRSTRPRGRGDRAGTRRGTGDAVTKPGGDRMSVREAAIRDAMPAEAPGAPRARMMLQRARWAAGAFAVYDRNQTRRIAEAVSEAAYQNAERFARDAVEETGMGVVEHKRRKNEACSRGIFERYGDDDYVGARIDPERKLVEVPKPAGVILALTPSTNPIATVYFKVMLSLLTRNAVVVSPHPTGPPSVRRGGTADEPCGGSRRRARRLPAGGRGADDPADRESDGGPGNRPDRRNGRHRRRAGRLPLGQSVAWRRPRERARARRRNGRCRARSRVPRRVQVVRQLDSLHERIDRDRRGAESPTG